MCRGCSGQKEKRRNKEKLTLPNEKLKDNESLHMNSQFSCFILCFYCYNRSVRSIIDVKM